MVHAVDEIALQLPPEQREYLDAGLNLVEIGPSAADVRSADEILRQSGRMS